LRKTFWPVMPVVQMVHLAVELDCPAAATTEFG